MDLGLKIPATLHLSISDKVLMVIGEFYINNRQYTLPTITVVDMVDCWVVLLLLIFLKQVSMVTRNVDIGLRPANFLPITVVDNTMPH